MFNQFNIDKIWIHVSLTKKKMQELNKDAGLLAKFQKDSLSCVQKVGKVGSGSTEAGTSVSQFTALRKNMREDGSAVTKQWRHGDIMSRQRTEIKTKWLVMVRYSPNNEKHHCTVKPQFYTFKELPNVSAKSMKA